MVAMPLSPSTECILGDCKGVCPPCSVVGVLKCNLGTCNVCYNKHLLEVFKINISTKGCTLILDVF